MRRLFLVAALISPFLAPSPVLGACTPEPASQWAPAGYICPPQYGEGIASVYDGSGVARNDCTWPFNCRPIRITSLDTGISVIARPVTWCHCWTGVTGPNGETQRIVDLDYATARALGLDPSRGLFRVTVQPATGSSRPAAGGRPTLPDTALR